MAEAQPKTVETPGDPPKEEVPKEPPKMEPPPPPVKVEDPKPRITSNLMSALNISVFSKPVSRMDADHTPYEHKINVNEQETLAKAVYETFLDMTTTDLPLNETDFVRMWKTLLVKRIQDIFESEKHRRSDNFIRLIRNIVLPAPLADLLHSLGHFKSTKTGKVHHLVPPPRAATPETFWTVDPTILENWNRLTYDFKELYTMKEYPSLSQCDARPMMLTKVNSFATSSRMVKSFTNETKMTDAFIHSMQDELFDSPALFAYDNCHLTMTLNFDHTRVRDQYVRSYVIDYIS